MGVGGTPWQLQKDTATARVTFYGHSHQSNLSIDGEIIEVKFGQAYPLIGEKILVNVGSIIGNREWVLYHSEKQTVTFMKTIN